MSLVCYVLGCPILNLANLYVLLEDQKSCVNGFRAWIGEIIENLTMLALSFDSAADARSYGLDAGWWQFLIVNATAESWARLHRIHTDPRIVPLHIQYVLGQKRWSVKMLEALPNLNHLDPESIPETLTHYVMVVLLDYLGSIISYLYGGSATGMSPGDHGSVALRHRIGNQHESMIALGHDAVSHERAIGSPTALFAHAIASLKNARRFYLAIASFPILEDASFQQKAKVLALNAENIGITYLDCINLNQKRQNTRTSRGATANRWSLWMIAVARPKNMPSPPWKGLNMVLPLTQSLYVVRTNIGRQLEIRERLRAYYLTTKRCYLPDQDLRKLREQLSIPSSESLGILHVYRFILRENNQSYQNKGVRNMAFKVVVYSAVINYCEATNPPLVTRPVTGKYNAPDPSRLDWQRISHYAQAAGPRQLWTTVHQREMSIDLGSGTE